MKSSPPSASGLRALYALHALHAKDDAAERSCAIWLTVAVGRQDDARASELGAARSRRQGGVVPGSRLRLASQQVPASFPLVPLQLSQPSGFLAAEDSSLRLDVASAEAGSSFLRAH
eukprot:1182643-Rhodomonas_salina.2